MAVRSFGGKLLVATPAIGDRNFERAVVFVLEHGDEGAFGLVLNRPTDLDLLDPLPQWFSFAASPAVVFVGGPVEQERAIALAKVDVDRVLFGWNAVIGGLGTLDLSAPPDEVGPGIQEIRVYAGYSGWSGDQLEEEVEAGAWFVVDALCEDVLCFEPEELWSTVLARQSGPVARFANYPRDPAVN